MLRQTHILGKGTRQITPVPLEEGSPFFKTIHFLFFLKKWGHKKGMGNCLAKTQDFAT
jgi:hypothetical protein